VQDSIWSTTLEAFHSDLAAPRSSPAAGGAAAVSARLAVSLSIKLFEIARNRNLAASDAAALESLSRSALVASDVIANAADEDGPAFAGYLDAVRKEYDPQRVDTAMMRAIEVPMTAARSSVRALELCSEALPLIPEFLSADLAAAVFLLSGAVRALLITVDYNLQQLSSPHRAFAAERVDLENQARRLKHDIVKKLNAESRALGAQPLE
jgi:methenyltetrahydrofolate cyclohydrolase